MRVHSLAHLSDAVLLRDLTALAAQDRVTTAGLLAYLAEVDARRLYVSAGYSSMHAYCVDELHLSEDAAYKRIQAARAGRLFPALFTALAEGRLHLAGACLLAPHLTPENLDELVDAASHRRKSEIEEMLARRFPPRGVPERAVTAIRPVVQLAPGQVGCEPSRCVGDGLPFAAQGGSGLPTCHDELAPEQVAEARMDVSPERYSLQVTIDRSTREKLRHAQALLSHAVPSGDVAQVLDRALEALIANLEKEKCGAVGGNGARTLAPRSSPRPAAARTRYVPVQVRRAVWERDQGQCTFVGTNGHRCRERRFLEFDHVDPVARGGQATIERVRLRCRAHNQFEAERIFGAGFMSRRRLMARREAAERATIVRKEGTQDVIMGLGNFGFRTDEARRAANSFPNGTLEDRLRSALTFLGRKSARTGAGV